MNVLIPLLWLAGVGQILVTSANVFAWRMFGYRENMARLTSVVGEIIFTLPILIRTNAIKDHVQIRPVSIQEHAA
jgi:FtsH-binding integral membrane protein